MKHPDLLLHGQINKGYNANYAQIILAGYDIDITTGQPNHMGFMYLVKDQRRTGDRVQFKAYNRARGILMKSAERARYNTILGVALLELSLLVPRIGREGMLDDSKPLANEDVTRSLMNNEKNKQNPMYADIRAKHYKGGTNA